MAFCAVRCKGEGFVRSFIRFLGLLAVVSLLVLVFLVKPRGDIDVFLGVWFGVMILVALPLLLVISFVPLRR